MTTGDPATPRLEFWYEFASTYSYLAALRIEDMAQAAGVAVVWRPFLLGPIFQAQGWSTSPFNIYPSKGRYMVRDIERIASSRGLKFQMPDEFPANGLKAARLALAGASDGWIGEFSIRVFEAEFAHGGDIADSRLLAAILRDMKLDPDAVQTRAQSPEVKAALRAQSARAVELGIFGAPSFVTPDGELFWGDDRLEQALAWAKLSRQGHAPA